MTSHRTIWMVAGLLAAIAAVGFAVREGRNAVRPEPALDTQMRALIARLETDPRVRQNDTQRLVEEVARLGGNGALRTAESEYAMGLYHYYGGERFEEAEAAFRNAMALRPDWAWPRNNLGVVLFEQGREREATDAWRKAIDLAPEWSRPYNDMAIMYRRAGRMDDAVDAIQMALRLDADGAVTNYNYGVLLDTLGHYEEAKAQYEKVLAMDETIAPAHYNLGCGYGRQGIVEPALKHLARAIELAPRFVEDALIDSDLDPIREQKAFQDLISASVKQPE